MMSLRRFRYVVELDINGLDDEQREIARPIEIREGLRTFLERAYPDISNIHVHLTRPLGYDE